MSLSETVVRIALPVMPSEVSYDDRWADAAAGVTAGESRRRSPRSAVPARSSPAATRLSAGGTPREGAGVPGRRTVTITGHGEEAWHTRNGTRPSRAVRHQHHLKRYERAGFRPDRVAMWAVLLGVMLMLAAAASSHAAVLASHHAVALLRLH